jgi:hypothetical protein
VRAGFSVASWAALGILVLGVLLRFAYLDSDPYYDDWAGYITDEGRWVENARSLALRGTLFEEPWNIHFLMAPLFQLGAYVAFVVGLRDELPLGGHLCPNSQRVGAGVVDFQPGVDCRPGPDGRADTTLPRHNRPSGPGSSPCSCSG